MKSFKLTDSLRHLHRHRHTFGLLGLLLLVVLAALYVRSRPVVSTSRPLALPHAVIMPKAGDVLGKDSVQTFTAAQTAGLIHANYGNAPHPDTGITKITFHYRSQLPEGDFITVYGRAYLPDDHRTDLPTFAFATGTTGISDKCAPSLEQPAVANWANYDSHMAMYASQGYAAVVTDYEGMRDPDRIHHYMVGELEGRAVLDAVRGLRNLPEAKGRLSNAEVFLGGYSQGGHAAFWADKIAAGYAPEIKPLGVVGFGPVMSVEQTLTDVTRGANINWFGPYVLYSYGDYYKHPYGPVLLPRWQDNLATDVPNHCIDTDIPYWGSVPANVYTPEFIQAVLDNRLGEQFSQFKADLDQNKATGATTPSAKRINEGVHDNVVLPAQQEAIVAEMCRTSKGPFEYVPYPHASHYSTMVQSLGDTLAWMRTLSSKGQVGSTCQ